jgi:hypothetical protein
MVSKSLRLCASICLLSLPAVAVAVPWHHPLYLDGGGWWRGRVRVVVRNELPRSAEGEPVVVKIGGGHAEADLVHQRAEAIRVCNERGQEMLFAVRGPEGDPIRRGLVRLT